MRTVLDIATGTATRKRGRASYREFAEQVLFAQRCDLHPDVRRLPYSATMTGINLPVRVAAQAKRKGVKRGAPDWMLYARGGGMVTQIPSPALTTVVLIERYVGLALEFKSPTGKGRPSADQSRWAEGLRAAGWLVEYPTTADGAWSLLVDYLGLK